MIGIMKFWNSRVMIYVQHATQLVGVLFYHSAHINY